VVPVADIFYLGTVGIEMASELKVIHPTKTVKLIQSRDKFLSSEPLPDNFKDQTLSLLEEAGVEVTLNNRVTDVTAVKSAEGSSVYKVTLSDGIQSMVSHVIWAISKSIPTADYLQVAALNNEGLPRLIRGKPNPPSPA
jgi:pyruvate/2-oxoglutarate dehydrogenase complex dihydrolipoamide dehydrogenase (E3) component